MSSSRSSPANVSQDLVLTKPDLLACIAAYIPPLDRIRARATCTLFRDAIANTSFEINQTCGVFAVAGSVGTAADYIRWHRMRAAQQNDTEYTDVAQCHIRALVRNANITVTCDITISKDNIYLLDDLYTARLRVRDYIPDFRNLAGMHTVNLSKNKYLHKIPKIIYSGSFAEWNTLPARPHGKAYVLPTRCVDVATDPRVQPGSPEDAGRLANIHTLDLSRSGLRAICPLGNIHTVDLTNCHQFITKQPRGDKPPAFAGVHTLILTGCLQINDVSMLGHIHTLNLAGCYCVTDVSMLGNVHTLNLTSCYRLSDVSMLGGVHTLDLTDCTAITDISALDSVHTLTLTGCKNVTVGPAALLDIARAPDTPSQSADMHNTWADCENGTCSHKKNKRLYKHASNIYDRWL